MRCVCHIKWSYYQQQEDTYSLSQEVPQQTESQYNGGSFGLSKTMPNNAHYNTKVGIAFMTRLDQLRHGQCGISVKGRIACKSKGRGPCCHMSFNNKVACTSKDCLGNNPTHVQ